MNPLTHRRCRHCRQRFLPDYRNAFHQQFCSAAACRHASKQASQRRWLRKPENRAYFREPDNLLRVRAWRLSHPGYWRTARRACEQFTDSGLDLKLKPESSDPLRGPGGTLQDFCRAKIPVLLGLISSLGHYALQEDIARCASRVVSEAQCILQQCHLKRPAPGQPAGVMNFHESG